MDAQIVARIRAIYAERNGKDSTWHDYDIWASYRSWLIYGSQDAAIDQVIEDMES